MIEIKMTVPATAQAAMELARAYSRRDGRAASVTYFTADGGTGTATVYPGDPDG